MRIIRSLIVCVVFVGYALATISYARVWENELTAWTRAAALAPLKPRPQINYALALMERRQFASADAQLTYAWLLTQSVSLTTEDRAQAVRAVTHNRAALARLMESDR